MNGSPAQPSADVSAPAPATLGPGMKSLLNRSAPGPEAETAPTQNSAVPPSANRLSGKIRLGLAAGDLMLVALALVLVFAPTGLARGVAVPLAASSVALAAWLGCLAIRGEG